MAYRRKKIGPTIAEYERQLAEALDVEPDMLSEDDGAEVDQAKTKTKAAKSLKDLREKWGPAFASWPELYDTWPEELRAEKKSTAVSRFADEDTKADDALESKVWTMADKRRKVAEADQDAASN